MRLLACILSAVWVLGTLPFAWPAAGAAPTCTPTRPDEEGPFYVPGAPERTHTGTGLVVFGTVRSQDCRPIPGAVLEWWSANSQGDYDAAHRARMRADSTGRYHYETDFPGRYPGRPPHLHVKVTAPGQRPLITQLYPTPDQTRLPVDLVLQRE